MMQKLGEFIVKRRWWVVSTWVLLLVVVIVSTAIGWWPTLASIQSDNQSSFLPSKYESVQAINIAKKVSKHSDAPTDIIVFKSSSGGRLTTDQQVEIGRVVGTLNDEHVDHVISVTTSSRQLSPDSKIQLGTIVYTGNGQDTASINAVKTVRAELSQLTAHTTVLAGVTGGQSISFDTQDSANRALKIVSIGTLLLVFFLPAFIFRSPLAGLFPLLSVFIVFTIASSFIALAGHIFNFHISQQLSILFTVVLYGIGTDYILFLLFRYREKLRSGDHSRGAVSFALSHAGEAIFSAALVVLTSFAALYFAKFGIFSSLAPGLVICVAVMMLAALTLVPAILAIIGERVFWPSRKWNIRAQEPTLAKSVGGLIGRRPGRVAAAVIIVLVLLTACGVGMRADFSSFSQPPKGTPSATAYNELIQAFPPGTLNPTQIYVTSTVPMTAAELRPLENTLRHTQGVSAVQPAVLLPNGKTAEVTIILAHDAYSAGAINDISGPIREAAHTFNTAKRQVYVGGVTSIFADVKAVTDRDLRVIFPIAAAFIFIILAILLRSLIAPLTLLLCVSLGYAATLGATTLIFQVIGNSSGIISFIPLFMYIFVVAIGTDYNILTITRLREEVKAGNKPRRAADLTVEHSSATVVAAGLILAATFGSLMLGGITFLTQMGAAIAIGVSLAAFVIAPFLIPSLSALLGYAIWWPSHRPGSR